MKNKNDIRILIACEYSGTVRDAFRAQGFNNVWSCDLLPTERPGLHYQGDVLNLLDGWAPVRHQCECDPEGNGVCRLSEIDTGECSCYGPSQEEEELEYSENDEGLFARPKNNPNWDLMICHPPCTFLSSSGLHWNKKRPERAIQTEHAINFVKILLNANIKHIALENPIGCLSTRIRKPNQIIQPWQFGHRESKSTCLWLKNLPNLTPTNVVTKNGSTWDNQTPTGQNKLGPSPDRWKIRSLTYQGIADAMAEQWGNHITNE